MKPYHKHTPGPHTLDIQTSGGPGGLRILFSLSPTHLSSCTVHTGWVRTALRARGVHLAGAHTLFERTTRYWSLQYATLTVPLEAPMRALSAAAVHMGAVDLRQGKGAGADQGECTPGAPK